MRQVLREEVWFDRRLRKLPVELHLAWVFLLPIADHHGRFRWDIEGLHLKIVRRGLPLKRWLEELWQQGVITKYQVDGKTFGRFVPPLTGLSPSQIKPSKLPKPTPTNVIRRPPRRGPTAAEEEPAQPVVVPEAPPPRAAHKPPAEVKAPAWLDESLLPVWSYYVSQVGEAAEPMTFAAEYGRWKKEMEGG
jgi:hypothetical protein